MDLSSVPTAALLTELDLRQKRAAAGLCLRCGRRPGGCGHRREPLVSVPPVTPVREPRVFNGVNPDCRPFRHAPDLSMRAFPADVPAPDASNPYATADDLAAIDCGD